jgi:hypothetical protein
MPSLVSRIKKTILTRAAIAFKFFMVLPGLILLRLMFFTWIEWQGFSDDERWWLGFRDWIRLQKMKNQRTPRRIFTQKDVTSEKIGKRMRTRSHLQSSPLLFTVILKRMREQYYKKRFHWESVLFKSSRKIALRLFIKSHFFLLKLVAHLLPEQGKI